jgi:hypothetical protein
MIPSAGFFVLASFADLGAFVVLEAGLRILTGGISPSSIRLRIPRQGKEKKKGYFPKNDSFNQW